MRLTSPPPSRMSLFEALRYARVGFSIRRALWHGGITEATPDPSPEQVAAAHPLVWIRHELALRHLRRATVAAAPVLVPSADANQPEHVVQALEVTSDDMRALDWTAESPQSGTNDIFNPNAGVSVPSDMVAGGGGGGDAGGSSDGGGASGGGGSGGGGEGSGGSGSSGAGGTGGGGGGRRRTRKKRPGRVPLGMSLTISRRLDGCIALLSNGGGGFIPAGNPITDQFSGNITLAEDPGGRGNPWFVTVKHGSPLGFRICYHGTLTPGSSAGFSFSITAMPGSSFGVQATAHLPQEDMNTGAGGSAVMRPNCDPPPPGGSGSGSGGSGGSGGGGGGGSSGGSFVPPA